MYSNPFDRLLFQTTPDDNRHPEMIKTGQPNLLSRLLAAFGHILSLTGSPVNRPNEVTDREPAADPVVDKAYLHDPYAIDTYSYYAYGQGCLWEMNYQWDYR
jgi:hypothetical protein